MPRLATPFSCRRGGTSAHRVLGGRSALGIALLLLQLASLGGATPAGTGPQGGSTNAVARQNPRYVIAPKDVLHLKVYQEEDLESRVKVSSEGTVILPLVGSIPVAGKTLDQATEDIRRALDKDFLVNPQISLTVAEYSKQKFMILGQVQRPGIYEFSTEEPLTLLQAVALAGGYTRMASTKKVTLQRMEAGALKTYSLKTEADPQNPSAAGFEIRPGDTINVGARIF